MAQPSRPRTPDDTIGARDLTAWHTRAGRRLLGVFTALARASRSRSAFELKTIQRTSTFE